MLKSFLCATVVGATAVSAQLDLHLCDDEVTCDIVEANELHFNCRFAGPANGTNVMFLHGFPEWSKHYIPLMRHWSQGGQNIRSVSCDLRGYSPLAAPEDPAAYDYLTLMSDVWALADSIFGETSSFHLVGHDHGAGLGWLTAIKHHEISPGRLLSYTALSVPHPDAFGIGLVGEEADEGQQVATNYFNQFALVDSATRNDNALTTLMGGGGFENPEAFQKGLWWYYGAMIEGREIFARPPYVSEDIVLKYGSSAAFVLAVRNAIPLDDVYGEDDEGIRGPPLGPVNVPTLFVCGTRDPYLLCNNDYALRTSDFVTGRYSYLAEPCGHNLMTVSLIDGCLTQFALNRVFSGITEHIMSVEYA